LIHARADTQQGTTHESLLQRLQKSLRRRGWLGTLGLCCWKVGHICAELLLPSRHRARRLDREFDARFGVDTRAIIPLSDLQIESANRAYGTEYEQTKPSAFRQLLSCAPIKYEDFIFVDFGSGLGRALLLASELPFKKIIGVEFAAELHCAAEENIRKYRSPTQQCKNFELLCLDAADYAIPHEPTVFYFYNPFQAGVLAQVLANIQRSLAEHPREVFIFYCNPVHRELLGSFGFVAIVDARWHAVYKSAAQAHFKQADG
jgi:SAM-dependent methyltransferase